MCPKNFQESFLGKSNWKQEKTWDTSDCNPNILIK